MRMEEDLSPAVQPQCSFSAGSVELPDVHPVASPSDHTSAHLYPKYPRSPAVKRFHQTYGTAPPAAIASTASAVHSTAKAALVYTENWIQNYHGTQLPQNTLSNSPSVTSLSSFASNTSALSIRTELSVITDLDQNEVIPCFPAIMQGNINPHFSGAASTCSFTENMDPNFAQLMDNHLCLLLENLRNGNEKNNLGALSSLNEIARTRKFVYYDNVDRIVETIQVMFHLLFQQTSSQKIQNVIMSTLYEMTLNRICIEAFNIFIYLTEGTAIQAICHFLKPNEKCGRFAITILHTLLYNRRTSKVSRCCAQHENVLSAIMNMINSSHCNYKQVAVDILRRILCNSKLKTTFKQNGGFEMCLQLMQVEAEEKILYRIAILMEQLLNSAEMGAHFIDCGGVQIIARYLDHPSPKLILTIAKCLAKISDSPKLSMQNLEDTLQRVVQILGSRDMDLVFHATGFLANMRNNNLKAKIFLHNNDAINNLMRLMHACTESTLIINERLKTLEIVENVLITLIKLTANYEGNQFYIFSACLQIITSCVNTNRQFSMAPSPMEEQNSMLNILASELPLVAPIILLNVIAVDYFNVGARAILILNRIIENIPSTVVKFEFTCDSYKNLNYSTHLMNVLFVTVEEYWKLMQNTAAEHTKIGQLDKVIREVLHLLSNFVTHSQNFKSQIGFICSSEQIPVILLPYLRKTLPLDMMKFLIVLTNDNEQLCSLWSTKEHVLKILRQQTLQSNNPEIVHYSNVVLERLEVIM